MEIKLEHLENGAWVDKSIELDVDADMSLSDETIDKDMCALPRVIAYYSELSTQLFAQAARHKQAMDSAEVAAAQESRRFAHETSSKITEPGIKEQVTLNKEVQEARTKYWASESLYRKLDGFYRALREKASLAIALCYKQKEEIRVMNSPIN